MNDWLFLARDWTEPGLQTLWYLIMAGTGAGPLLESDMPKAKRSDNWGFPRWGSYESSREAEKVKLCDRHGCNEVGNCPAPKSPNSPEKWYFCQTHTAEYNRGWNYFEGLDKEERKKREADEQRDANAYQEAKHYRWMALVTAVGLATR